MSCLDGLVKSVAIDMYPNFSTKEMTAYFVIKGSLIHLWPDGYKNEVEDFSSSAEPFQYVYDNYLDNVKAALPVRKIFLEMAKQQELILQQKLSYQYEI